MPGAGSLTLSGTAVTANQVIATADIPNLVFTPEADASGSSYANFKFTVSDGSEDSGVQTITLNVDSVNDAPETQLTEEHSWSFNDNSTDNLTLANGAISSQVAGSDGNVLSFTGTGTRAVTTEVMDTSSGGSLSFDLIYASSTNGVGETLDAGDEVSLQYSTDGGANWSTHATYALNQHQNWNTVNESLSGNLQASSIQFRIIPVSPWRRHL